MRNANIEDVMCAINPACYTPTDVMFLVDHPTFGKHKAHIKGEYYGDKVGFVMEDVNGYKMYAEKEWLRPVPRKLGTPAKPKRTPKKGTKPWLGQGVPYDPALIKVGVKVVCRDGNVAVVKDVIHMGGYGEVFTSKGDVDLATGVANFQSLVPVDYDIIRILVDKPEFKHDDLLDAAIYRRLAFPKQIAKENNVYAHNVWHFWQGEAYSPAIGGDVVVQYWLRGDTIPTIYSRRVACLTWKWENSPYDIIAFKIIE